MISLYNFIIEKQSINFGSAKANYGQCIILAGGPGSGKGYVKNHRILTDFKSVDVDDLKNMYIKLQKKGKNKDEYEYNLGNEEDVSKLHMKVKEKGWKSKQREHFWKQHDSNNGHLPNILWDMVSDDIKDIEEIIKYAKPIGYNVTLVWVCCNMDTAREGNKHRERHVSDEVIVKGHKGAYKVLTDLLTNKYPKINTEIDAVWIAFSAGYKRVLTGKYKSEPVIKIKKDNDNNFIFDKSFVDAFLKEQMPQENNKANESINEEYHEDLEYLVNMIKGELL